MLLRRLLLLTLFLSFITLTTSACSGTPYTTEECIFSKLVSPAANAVFFANVPENQMTISWSSGACILTYTLLTPIIYINNAQIATPSFAYGPSSYTFSLVNYDAKYSWGMLGECWGKDNIFANIPNPTSPYSNPGWNLAYMCYASQASECYRVFTFCRRQPITVLEAQSTTTFRQGSSIPFSWQDISSNEPLCNTQVLSFYYTFSIWSGTGSSTTETPIFTTTISSISTPTYTLAASVTLPPGDYHWSVRSTRTVSRDKALTDTSTTTLYASPLQFRICGPDVAPTSPTLTAPTNNLQINSAQTTLDENLPATTVPCTWQILNFGQTCFSGTQRYDVYWSKDPNFSNPKHETLTSTTISKPFSDGKWYWYVTASNGVLTNTSSIFTFTVCILTPPAPFINLSPLNNAQEIDYSSVTFSWQSTTAQATCATSQITYTLYLSHDNPSSFVQNYTGPLLTYTTPLEKGTWYWYVTAKDSLSQIRSSNQFSFVTLASLCSDSSPSTPTLIGVNYIWSDSSIKAILSWNTPYFGITCEPPPAAASTIDLVILDSSSQVYASISLDKDETTYQVSPPQGEYTWSIVAINEGNEQATSASGNFEICDSTIFSTFATSFQPSNSSIFLDKSLDNLMWQYTSPMTCLGASVKYKLNVDGKSSFFYSFSDQLVTNYSIPDLESGIWTWTLSNDISDIPIANLPTVSYTNRFYLCTPTNPSAPVLISPPRFSTIVGNTGTLTYTHNRTNIDTCSPFADQNLIDEQYKYEVLTSPSSNFQSSVPICNETLELDNTTTTLGCTLVNLTTGSLYWKVRVIKEISVDSILVSSFTKDSSTSVSSICINSPPNIAVPSLPSNGTKLERCDISLSLMWEPLELIDFGTDCSQSPQFGVRVYIGKDLENFPDKTFEVIYSQNETDPFSTIKDGLLPNTTYYWQIETSNTHFAQRSEFFTFVTPDTSITPCSGHGNCLSNGACSCEAGYTGEFCATYTPPNNNEPTEPSEFSSTKSDTGMIIGIVVGVFGFLILLSIIGLFYLRKKMKERDQLEKPKRNPPDFPSLAFVVPSGFPPLNQEQINSWEILEQMLLFEGFALAKALLDITQATEIDDITKSLVYIIEFHDRGSDFVKDLITKDLNDKKESHTLQSTTLFRDNSHASKSFNFYAKIVGMPYLFYTLGDPIYDMVHIDFSEQEPAQTKSRTLTRLKSHGSSIELSEVIIKRNSSQQSTFLDVGSFEVDPNKMTEDDDSQSNALFLQLKCQKIVFRIFRSASIFPTELVDILCHLMSEVESHLTTQDGMISVAGFVFLRLINPSILFPKQYGLVESLPKNDSLTRQLILITKVIQNLANGVHFGFKEPHMAPLNDFIDSNRDSLGKFLEKILQKGQSNQSLAGEQETQKKEERKLVENDPAGILRPIHVPRSVVDTSLIVVYNHLHRNQERVIASLSRYVSSTSSDIFEKRMNSLISEIGDPIQRDFSRNENVK